MYLEQFFDTLVYTGKAYSECKIPQVRKGSQCLHSMKKLFTLVMA